MFERLLTESAARLRGVPVEDPYSGEHTGVDWSDPERLELPKVSVQPVKGEETTFDRAAVTERFWLWVPGLPDITAHDRIEHRGVVYDIEGDVLQWSALRPHTQVMLKHQEG